MVEFIKRIAFITVIVLILIGGYFLYKLYTVKKQSEPVQQAMPVMIAKPVVKDITRYNYFTGKSSASEAVEIRARVKGFLTDVAFKDSENVEKGQLLFKIEPEAYIAERDRALAELQAAQTDLQRAELDYERVQEAVKDNAVSKQEVSRRKADRDMAQAKVTGGKAALVQAELNLSYTNITSPISGRIKRKLVDVGNLVGGNEMTLLTTIVKIEPIDIYFNMSESILLKYLMNRSEKDQYGDKTFYVGFGDDKGYPHSGSLDFMDNVVDSSTGTIQIRGKIPNIEHKILPGLFAKVKVPDGTKKDAVLIDEKAIATDLAGKFVYIMGPENIPQKKHLQLAEIVDGLRVVEEGLDGTETYVMTGIQLIRPNTPVQPMTPEQMQAINATQQQNNSPKSNSTKAPKAEEK